MKGDDKDQEYEYEAEDELEDDDWDPDEPWYCPRCQCRNCHVPITCVEWMWDNGYRKDALRNALESGGGHDYECDTTYKFGVFLQSIGEIEHALGYFAYVNYFDNGDCPRANFRIGQILYWQGRYLEAVSSLVTSVSGGKRIPEAHAMLSLALIKLGWMKPAEYQAMCASVLGLPFNAYYLNLWKRWPYLRPPNY